MAQQSTQPHPYTRDIATFVSGLTYDKIPEEVRHRNKLLMLDSLGCALYGADLEWTRILQDKLSSIDSTRQCSVWGTNKKLSAPHAALVNGTQVQGFELEVLRGAQGLFSNVEVIVCEVLLAAFYEGQTKAEDLLAFLRAHGFLPIDFDEPVRTVKSGKVLYLDVAFARAVGDAVSSDAAGP